MKEEIERTPLRTILTNFLNHIDTLENQRTHDNTYESEFQELKLFSESIKGTKQYSCSEGEKEVNRKKNRYKDILPFDLSRVVLNEYAGVPGSDYINANYIKGASGSPAYIASQGPLPHTVNDFWRMVVQCEVQVIIMACNEEEAGKHKCENYWVEGDGEEKQFGMVSLRLLKASTVCPDFSVRTMRLKYTNTQSNIEERTVCQFHYSTWPDHGVPPLVRPLLDMVRLVRDTQASETLPVLIHCSAGCGRTGTICAIDYVWGLLRAGKLTKDFSLLTLVREMRRQRIAMVQTKEQYVLVHQAVRELFKEQLRMIDSHPYENIDCNGLPLIKCPSPEPTYDSITTFQNNKVDEKQDEKEKEVAPPLPQKKRFQILSSKQAKEVENLSERQRLVEQGGSSSESVASTGSSGTRPRIAILRSLFERQHSERDSRQVARSHSLGSVRPPTSHAQPQPSPVEVKVKEPSPVVLQPIPGRGILRVPKRPALPVKRSKSLRVLGSGDRCKLSIPPPPPCELDMPRRLSLESNYDDLVQTESGQQTLSDYLSVDSIVAGLGVRERRNSFRQAVHRESTDVSKTIQPLLRSYTSADMRSAREKPNMIKDNPPPKPILKPKPNMQLKSNGNMASDPKLQFLNQQHLSPKQFSDFYQLNRKQVKASSSRPLTSHSMSLRLAPKPKREDCRVLTSSTAPSRVGAVVGMSQQSDAAMSSGESSVSCSSDQSSLHSKSLSNSMKPTPSTHTKLQMSNTKGESLDSGGKEKQISQSTHHKNMLSSRSVHDISNPIYQQNNISASSISNETGHASKTSACTSQPSPGKPERVGTQQYYQRIKSSHDVRKQPPSQSSRPIYDSKSVRQNSSTLYGSVPKVPPPPYVEPGKNAQKPRSSPQFVNDRQTNITQFNSEVYSKTQDQRHWPMVGSSRDIILPSHSSSNKPNLTGTDVRINMPEPSAATYIRNLERRHLEPDYRLVSRDMYKKASETRKPDVQDYRCLAPESQTSTVNEKNYLESDSHMNNDRRFEVEVHKNTREFSSQNVVDRRYVEQTFRKTIPEAYFKSYNEKKMSDQNLQLSPQDQISKALMDRRKQDLNNTRQDPYHRNSGQKRTVNQELSRTPQEAASKFVERGYTKDDFNANPSLAPSMGSMGDKEAMNPQDHFQSPAERRPLPNYQPGSEEMYPKLTASNRTPADKDFQRSQDPRTVYMPMSRTVYMSQLQGNWLGTPAKEISVYSNESEKPTNHGVKMRRGSQDDLALCATTPSRVKRHASVVLLRHSLIEGGNADSAASPLSVWNQTNSGLDPTTNQAPSSEDDPWSGAVGVDLDQVAASINTQKDGKMMKAALEALHLRKASQVTPKAAKASQPSPKQSQAAAVKSSQPTPNYSVDASKTAASPPQFQPPPPPQVAKPGVFRKQQQYL